MSDKSLTPELVSQHLMMHAAYWKECYKKSISKLIKPDDKLTINSNIHEAVVFMKNARKKIHEIEYTGRDFTRGLYSIYQELDRLMEKLLIIQKEVNGEGMEINLNDYPINAVSQ